MRKSIQRSFYMVVVLSILFGIASPGVMAYHTDNNFTYEIVGGGVSVTEYSGYSKDVVIPDILGGRKVIAIGDSAFSYRDDLTSIVMPDSIVSIGEEAFLKCRGLTELKIPEGVTFIDECAFDHCDKLTSITLPEGITSIRSYTFTQCSGLTSITIPNGVTSIEWAAFSYCTGLNSIIIPESVTSISGLVFKEHNESFVIYGLDGSYAETFANEEGIQFSVIKDDQIAKAVYDQINILPAAGSIKLTDKVAVTEARTAYNKLTAVQKTLVNNLDKLKELEKRIADLEAGENTQIPIISYQTHVQNIGWQEDVLQGGMSGTEGMGYRLESIRISFEDDANYDLGIAYSTHVENIGWQAEFRNGQTAGTTDRGLRLEAIKIRLIGADSDKFDIYYQVHAQNFGWLDWAKNEDSAGTAGFGYRLEAIRISVVPKGDPAPGATSRPFVQMQ